MASRPERVFVLAAIPLGLLILLLTPPFQIPDEPPHFYRAFEISEGHLLAPLTINRGTRWGDDLPKSLPALVDASDVAITRFRPERKLRPARLLAELRTPLNAGEREVVPVAEYPPVAYVAQALGIAVGRPLGLSPMLLFYLGRLSALGAWIALVFFAIKGVPVLKWTYVLLALMPMSLSLAASYSPDSLVIGVSFLLVARLLAWVLDDGSDAVGLLDRLGVLVLALVLTLTKAVYLPVLALCLLVPRRRLGGTLRYVLTIGVIVVACVVAHVVWKNAALAGAVVEGPEVGTARHGSDHSPMPDVSPGRQFDFIRSHPLAYVRVLSTTLIVHGRGYLVGFVGALGWLETRLPVWLPYLYVLVLTVVSWMDSARERVGWTTKGAGLAIVALIFFGALTALYGAYSSVGLPTVEGFQGRYLIPLAPLIFLPLCGRRPRWRITNAVAVALILFAVLSTILAGYSLVKRFYLA